MSGWISRRIEKAGWAGFAVWFAILFVFSTWAFDMDSPWTRALEAAGGVLPETKPGIPALEPVRSLTAMGADKGDYLLWQALDIPYALMNFFYAAIGIGLALKAVRLENTFLRFLILVPALYVACELVENAFLASFAAGLLKPVESAVLVQQFATTVKFAAGIPCLFLGAGGALIALVAGLTRRLRKKPG